MVALFLSSSTSFLIAKLKMSLDRKKLETLPKIQASDPIRRHGHIGQVWKMLLLVAPTLSLILGYLYVLGYHFLMLLSKTLRVTGL